MFRHGVPAWHAPGPGFHTSPILLLLMVRDRVEKFLHSKHSEQGCLVAVNKEWIMALAVHLSVSCIVTCGK